ncbi:hypothetical protein TEQG_02424 [Trichophyton equinum CBS 127.97]|uniref:Uncharacterized protein n=1 Tax=Trichophyton equinum (strain ATCC MYA-4606 / CBS 127.97) TaxID=559882 RepID=F2PNC0_TRIEC|nr:hypothetical protein TEQG_02424 [Trichophyton equinum CBS 127.97]
MPIFEQLRRFCHAMSYIEKGVRAVGAPGSCFQQTALQRIWAWEELSLLGHSRALSYVSFTDEQDAPPVCSELRHARSGSTRRDPIEIERSWPTERIVGSDWLIRCRPPSAGRSFAVSSQFLSFVLSSGGARGSVGPGWAALWRGHWLAGDDGRAREDLEKTRAGAARSHRMKG